VLAPPLEGEWKFLRPPGHHPYAFDFVQTDSKHKRYHDGNSFNWYLGGINANRYFCWEQNIFSPVTGVVARVADDWPDRDSTSLYDTIRIWYEATYRFRPSTVNGRLDIRPNAGNHVMIQADEGFIVFLAHMRHGSLTVKEGQRVNVGEAIGAIGNSGNSTAPHLHINLFDQIDDPYQAKVLPFVFDEYELLESSKSWGQRKLSVPEKGAYIRFNRV